MIERDENGLLDSLNDDLALSGMRFDPNLVHRFVASLLTKRFVILTGVTGSGKTRLAQAFAYWMSGGFGHHDFDSKTPSEAMVFSDGWLREGQDAPGDQTIYRVDAVDSLAVQFSNERKGQRVKVTLPNGLIDEWVKTIQRFGFSRDTPAREIREQVAKVTGYSTQLNSFETHLKAAAFAIMENTKREPSSKESRNPNGAPHPPTVEDVNDELSGRRVEVVAVGADWNSSESVLGYPDALQIGRYVRTPMLDLILRAAENPDLPHFLILDEMNLSHVERYFSDFLSAMESGEPIHLFSGSDSTADNSRDGVPASVAFPDNLFVIGTVNVDETTYMFSPKVLDRANTMEFRLSIDQLKAFLENPVTTDLGSLDGKGAIFASSFLRASRDPLALSPDVIQWRVSAEIELFFSAMASHGNEFGYRTAFEMSRFVRQFQRLDARDGDLGEAPDAQIYQKVLPRLSGSRARLEPVLHSLLMLCRLERQWDVDHLGRVTLANRAAILAAAQAPSQTPQHFSGKENETTDAAISSPSQYPLSESKILRMLQLLQQNGFTSFAEA